VLLSCVLRTGKTKPGAVSFRLPGFWLGERVIRLRIFSPGKGPALDLIAAEGGGIVVQREHAQYDFPRFGGPQARRPQGAACNERALARHEGPFRFGHAGHPVSPPFFALSCAECAQDIAMHLVTEGGAAGRG